jgi:hypothetical protein
MRRFNAILISVVGALLAIAGCGTLSRPDEQGLPQVLWDPAWYTRALLVVAAVACLGWGRVLARKDG